MLDIEDIYKIYIGFRKRNYTPTDLQLVGTVSQEKQIQDAGHRIRIQNIHSVQRKELHPYRSATIKN